MSVDFIIVGAHAMAYHGCPRFTGDLDLVIRQSKENARRVLEAVHAFGFGETGLKAEDFSSENQVVQLGFPPNRIDILTSITGVSFDALWADRIETDLDGLPVCFMSRPHLVQNKKALGRPKDLADLDFLGVDSGPNPG